MNIDSNDRNNLGIARNLSKEQAKPFGLFAGLVRRFTNAFEEHKQYLEELVMAQRELILGEEEKQELAAATPKPFLLGLLDKWLFPEKEELAKTPTGAPPRELEVMDLSLKTRPNPEMQEYLAKNSVNEAETLGNLFSPRTPAVARSQSQNVGHSMVMVA